MISDIRLGDMIKGQISFSGKNNDVNIDIYRLVHDLELGFRRGMVCVSLSFDWKGLSPFTSLNRMNTLKIVTQPLEFRF